MLKKIFLTMGCVLLVAGGGIYLFKGQLWDVVQEILTEDMFVAADTDSFNPGLAVGNSFPAIKAIYQERVVTDVRGFVHDKGMVFITNRSADW